MLLHGGEMVSYDIEPFLTSYGKLATDSAYPHDQSPLPVCLVVFYVMRCADVDSLISTFRGHRHPTTLSGTHR